MVRDRQLPLATIDRLIQLLDSPVEPWSIQLEVRVARSIDEVRLRQAVGAAVATHDRWQARVVRPHDRWRHPRWEIAAGAGHHPLDAVDCSSDLDLAAARAELYSQPSVQQAAPPLLVRLARHRDGDVIMLNLHHAVGDGFAAVSFLRSVARSYADPNRPTRAAILPPDASATDAAGGLVWNRHGLGHVARELREMARRAARVARDGATHRPGYGFHHVALSAQETARLVTERPDGASVNDVLLAALHLAIAGWNADHGQGARRISVYMPVNLRPAHWHEAGVANLSFPVAIATGRGERVSPASALAAVTRRTAEAKADRAAEALLPALRWLLRLPPGPLRRVAAVLSAGPAVPTAVLTNLGRLEEQVWLGPPSTEVWMSPPVKMPSGLAVGAVTAGGRLFLSFRFRHAQFGPEAASRFARRYLAAVRSVVALGPDLRLTPGGIYGGKNAGATFRSGSARVGTGSDRPARPPASTPPRDLKAPLHLGIDPADAPPDQSNLVAPEGPSARARCHLRRFLHPPGWSRP